MTNEEMALNALNHRNILREKGYDERTIDSLVLDFIRNLKFLEKERLKESILYMSTYDDKLVEYLIESHCNKEKKTITFNLSNGKKINISAKKLLEINSNEI